MWPLILSQTLAFLHSGEARLIAIFIIAICEYLLLFSLLDPKPRS